ncbi:MAG: hypothetical protein D6797_06740, partial [Bdellovibrio sp.]
TLHVPQGLESTGYGQFSLSGSWLPYLLKINYTILSGKMEKNLSATKEETSSVVPSQFLPDFLNKQKISPLHLYASVNIKNNIQVAITSIGGIKINTPISGQLLIKGPPSSPLLKGILNTGENGKIYFRSNVFDIKAGILKYNTDPPDNPSLNIIASALVTDSEGNKYDVDMFVRGHSSNPQIHLVSQPPLAEHQIISLLALGIIPQENTAPSEGKYEIGTNALTEPLGLNTILKKQLGVKIDLKSSIDTDNEAEHTVTIQKQWNPHFGASASRSFGKKNANRVKIEYKLNRSMSLVGRWQQEEKETKADTEESLGLDLEYKIEFK